MILQSEERCTSAVVSYKVDLNAERSRGLADVVMNGSLQFRFEGAHSEPCTFKTTPV